jgi:hypothetical protein
MPKLAPTLQEISSKKIAEEATGLPQRGKTLGAIYLRGGRAVSPAEAQHQMFNLEQTIEVPNAGAGSYRQFFELVGCKRVEVWESCSSAGDWTFVVQDYRDGWYAAQQTNRYPHYGFTYTVIPGRFSTREEAEDYLRFHG